MPLWHNEIKLSEEEPSELSSILVLIRRELTLILQYCIDIKVKDDFF